MKPAGVRQVELAKADGRWAQAYDSPSKHESAWRFPEGALSRREGQGVLRQSLNRANVYAIAWRLQTAKKLETRARSAWR